jgi:hypothetical protein
MALDDDLARERPEARDMLATGHSLRHGDISAAGCPALLPNDPEIANRHHIGQREQELSGDSRSEDLQRKLQRLASAKKRAPQPRSVSEADDRHTLAIVEMQRTTLHFRG